MGVGQGMQQRVMRRRAPSGPPYGLLILLALYALAVVAYVWVTHWRSAEYLAAEHFVAAGELLGLDDGRKASKQVLTEAYQHYLEAARLMPGVKLCHQRVEAMRWRFDERGFKMDHDLAMRGEAMATLWQRMEQEQAPVLVVGVRDRGWHPTQVLERPSRAVWWSVPGALAIVLAWAWVRFSSRLIQRDEREKTLQGLESEVKALAGNRPAPPKPKPTSERSRPPRR